MSPGGQLVLGSPKGGARYPDAAPLVARTIETPNGPVEVSYTFKADGAKLTGNTTGPDGTKIDIKDGKLDGDKISFTLDLDMGGGPTSFKYTGMVSADAIALSSDFQGQAFQFTLKKAAK